MATTTRCQFLDLLPPEIRIQIYTHLLVSPIPIKGTLARKHQHETYNLHTSILRTNSQIHAEARAVFFGKNTFYITSIPSLDATGEEEESGAFEPPLQLKDLPLIRHLEIDLLYYPRFLRTTSGREGWGWHSICPAAQRYVASLSYVLGLAKNLVGLKILGDVRRYVERRSVDEWKWEMDASEGEEVEERELDVKKFLVGFHMADHNLRFRNALACLPVENFSLRFDFPESHFDFVVGKEELLKTRLVQLAGQVLIARSELRMRSVLAKLGEDDVQQMQSHGYIGKDQIVTSLDGSGLS